MTRFQEDPRTDHEQKIYPFHMERTHGNTWGIYKSGQYYGPETPTGDEEKKDALLAHMHQMNVEYSGAY